MEMNRNVTTQHHKGPCGQKNCPELCAIPKNATEANVPSWNQGLLHELECGGIRRRQLYQRHMNGDFSVDFGLILESNEF